MWLNFLKEKKRLLETQYSQEENETEETGMKILTPKQILQKLPIAVAHVMQVTHQKV